ncbi:hypothetical protein IH992_34835, partial [Candidatus Poribacteria bacterium]|nr:hypothetical protein [Candidatus Poribacteria bacterium]
AIPSSFISTPDEEFAVNRVFLKKAATENLKSVSLIWHPWSLDAFDPDMKMLELTFAFVRELGLEPSTYQDLFRHVHGEMN